MHGMHMADHLFSEGHLGPFDELRAGIKAQLQALAVNNTLCIIKKTFLSSALSLTCLLFVNPSFSWHQALIQAIPWKSSSIFFTWLEVNLGLVHLGCCTSSLKEASYYKVKVFPSPWVFIFYEPRDPLG